MRFIVINVVPEKTRSSVYKLFTIDATGVILFIIEEYIIPHNNIFFLF